jgi:hypothetical protein
MLDFFEDEDEKGFEERDEGEEGIAASTMKRNMKKNQRKKKWVPCAFRLRLTCSSILRNRGFL